uniref:Ribonuclease H-like domain, reverse transcriptase, RNA-dependent DNA polymerase n=1 Tax=Tanacetum cinerariifolium TaxID=118510 RepID=A0A699H762_TANCI|nr:ribonuclease H-like domain, reverse transcriptase, RNA-dependent DNA polymerase [Tanacetum cinerariifolium]GEW98199.1 ribonuclease H-like domain, reverse transcriptase, RNA-dependent DNA polymerase [Tanacetum cinerariifolium]
MGELAFFLGLQVDQSEEGIFISQYKYVTKILNKFDFSSVKTTSTPIETQKPLVKDEVVANVDVHLYRSMIGSLMYLMASRPNIMFAAYACSRRLSSWQCKKQTIVASSTTEAEYVAATNCCGQMSLSATGFSLYWLMKLYTASTIVNAAELKKTDENVEFHQIVDFLSTCSINYALTEISSRDKPRNQETTLGGAYAQTRFKTASKRSSDPPLSTGHTPGSDEGRPNITELMNLYTQLSNMVLSLKQSKTTQDLVIQRLLKKVKRLEKKQRVRTLIMKLFKIGTSKKKTLDKEYVSKKERDESKEAKELNLSDKGSGETEVFDYTTAAKKDVNAAEPVSTIGDAVNAASVVPDVSVTGPSTSTARDIFKDDMITIADTLMAIRRTTPRM